MQVGLYYCVSGKSKPQNFCVKKVFWYLAFGTFHGNKQAKGTDLSVNIWTEYSFWIPGINLLRSWLLNNILLLRGRIRNNKLAIVNKGSHSVILDLLKEKLLGLIFILEPLHEIWIPKNVSYLSIRDDTHNKLDPFFID
jgi:hypothetical protein